MTDMTFSCAASGAYRPRKPISIPRVSVECPRRSSRRSRRYSALAVGAGVVRVVINFLSVPNILRIYWCWRVFFGITGFCITHMYYDY